MSFFGVLFTEVPRRKTISKKHFFQLPRFLCFYIIPYFIINLYRIIIFPVNRSFKLFERRLFPNRSVLCGNVFFETIPSSIYRAFEILLNMFIYPY